MEYIGYIFVFMLVCCFLGCYLMEHYEEKYDVQGAGVKRIPAFFQVLSSCAAIVILFFSDNGEKGLLYLQICCGLAVFFCIIGLYLCFRDAKRIGATSFDIFCVMIAQFILPLGAFLALVFCVIVFLLLSGGSDDKKKDREKMKKLIIYNEIQDEEDKLF